MFKGELKSKINQVFLACFKYLCKTKQCVILFFFLRNIPDAKNEDFKCVLADNFSLCTAAQIPFVSGSS